MDVRTRKSRTYRRFWRGDGAFLATICRRIVFSGVRVRQPAPCDLIKKGRRRDGEETAGPKQLPPVAPVRNPPFKKKKILKKRKKEKSPRFKLLCVHNPQPRRWKGKPRLSSRCIHGTVNLTSLYGTRRPCVRGLHHVLSAASRGGDTPAALATHAHKQTRRDDDPGGFSARRWGGAPPKNKIK